MKNRNNSPIPALTALLLWSALAMLTCFMNSCAPDAVIMTPIAPAASHLKGVSESAMRAAERVTGRAISVSAQSTALGSQYIAAVLDAERIRKSGVATQADLDSNSRRWQDMQAANLILLESAKSAVIDGRALEAAAASISVEAGELEKSAIKTDAGMVAQQTKLASVDADAAAWRKLKFVGWVALSCAAVWLFIRYCLPVIIKASKPL